MDNTLKYQQIIIDLLQEYASIKKTLTPDVKAHLIVDKENQQFQLVSIGWHNHKYIYLVAFHLAITAGKVWIHQNNTDALIADELEARGIAKIDIILGFVPERARSLV